MGKPTANGEAFVPSAISGAHKTLPLPSYVEVTALNSVRTILVRLNDRGPFSDDKLIDLSRGAPNNWALPAMARRPFASAGSIRPSRKRRCCVPTTARLSGSRRPSPC
ncbi:septal ring lytic transglycosylase RlpA family protein [Sphingobium scionense]